jgi:Protein of unknown function (DUF3047)
MITRLSTALLMLAATMQVFSQAPAEQEPWNVPQGWSYVLNVGPPEIYQFGTSSQAGKTMEINTHQNAGILARDVSLENDDDITISWDWQVDTLPSEVTEEIAETHDYLSVAVLFDNGQDISYVWSSGLEEGTVFRCPLPDWADKETHLVIRSDTSELGKWLSEERNLKADYARYIGGEMPTAINQVWLISNSIFQGGVGKARVANISIGSDTQREKVL